MFSFTLSPMNFNTFSFGENRVCNIFTRISGKSLYKKFPSAGTIAVGAAVQFDENGECVIGATNKQIIGIAVAAATSSTDVSVDVIDHNSVWKASAITTTPLASDIGKQIDFASSSGVAVDTGVTTNNDFTVVGFDPADTANVYVCFNQGGLTKTVVGVE